MIDIVALIALCKLANDSKNKALEEYKKRKISDTEKELLIAAAPVGEFLYMHVDEADWIRIGSINFPPDISGDPAIGERYYEAFGNLCKRGYIRHIVDRLFTLTSIGFEKARELAQKKNKSMGHR